MGIDRAFRLQTCPTATNPTWAGFLLVFVPGGSLDDVPVIAGYDHSSCRCGPGFERASDADAALLVPKISNAARHLSDKCVKGSAQVEWCTNG